MPYEVFEEAMNARARWKAGILTKIDRVTSDIPSFAESMSEMFIGRRGMEAQKKIFGGLKDDPANKAKKK